MLSRIAIIVLLAAVAASAVAEAAPSAKQLGKQLAFDRDKGNCLACHVIADGESPGDIGPPLSGLKKRFKNKRQLREQIWDATRFNPQTSMPPFGRNKVLTEAEIDAIVNYLWSLP